MTDQTRATGHRDVADMVALLIKAGVRIQCLEPIGSRVTCDPAPAGTDEDWLLLIGTGRDHDAAAALRAAGFEQDGNPQFYTGSDAGSFRSWRLGDLNVVTTPDTDFFDRFMTATHLAKRFNLIDKADRIALFQAVLYGVRAERLEMPMPSRTTAGHDGRTTPIS